MSGTFPVTDFDNVTIKSTAPTITTVAISGQRQSKQIAGQYFEIDIDLVPLSRAGFASVMGFLSKQRNALLSFQIVIPRISTASGDVVAVGAANTGLSDVMLVTSNVSAGGSTVAFDTAYNSSYFTGTLSANQGLRAGDFVKFSNHDKVYQITEDVTFNVTGGGTMTIFPNLTDGVVGSTTTITYKDVPFTVFSKNSTQEYAFGTGDNNKISLSLQEAL